jgi:hypothetical protein
MNDSGRFDNIHGDEDDLANEEYERQRQQEEQDECSY